MPVSDQYNEVKNEPPVTLDEGNYNFQVVDVIEALGDPNSDSPWGDRDQFVFFVACLDGEDRGSIIRMFITMSFNPGFDKGQPSWLFLLTKAVKKKNLDGSEAVKVNELIGGCFNGYVKHNSKGFPKVKGFDRFEDTAEPLSEEEMTTAKEKVLEMIDKKRRKDNYDAAYGDDYDESEDVGNLPPADSGNKKPRVSGGQENTDIQW